ncbi:3-hydroxyisobutyryl-coenzyme A hydrolase [Clavulina sp. PMI_390]|nr:3-hydroxyisobutyryl-coenzyme A hydrolase [Clavulina sp. PMI_390]
MLRAGSRRVMTSQLKTSSSATSRLGLVSRHMASASSAAGPSGSGSSSGPSHGDEAPVLFEQGYSTRTFILNRPRALNALDQEMINMITPKIAEWNKSELCKIIVSRGNGRAFCAGGEVKSLAKFSASEDTRPLAIQYFKSEFQLDYNLATLEKPYVAVMDGITMGGGVGLSAFAPFRIATPKTLFAMPETKIGYAPDVGSTYVLARLDGEIGTYLALTANTLTGEECFRLGLATHFVESARIPQLLDRLASLENPDRAQINSAIEEFADDVDGARLGAKEGAPPSIITGEVRQALDYAFAPSQVEEIFSRLEALAANEQKSADVRQWASETRQALEMRSPTSLRVALEAVRRASGDGYRLSDAFQTELGIATACVSGGTPDFIKGINAVLIDKLPKDQRPDWSPSTLAEVDPSWVKSTFFDSRLSSYVRDAPRLSPGPSGKTDADLDLNFWALPRERNVRAYVLGEAKDSGEYAISFEDLVTRFERRKSGKKGVRAKLQEIVDRCCDVEEGGWLKWK